MKKFRVFSLLLLAILCTGSLYAQKQGKARTDSLLGELLRCKNDSEKVRLFQSISLQYIQTNPSNALNYLHRALELSKKSNKKELIASTLGLLGKATEYNFDTSYYYHRLALEEIKASRDTALFGQYYMALAYLLENSGWTTGRESKNTFNPETLSCVDSALYYSIVSKDTSMTIEALCRKGEIFMYLERMEDAAVALKTAEAVFNQLKDKNKIAWSYYPTFGEYYLLVRKYDSAIFYFQKSLYFSEQDQSLPGISYFCARLGVTYAKLKKFDKAEAYAARGLRVAVENNLQKELIDNYTASYHVYKDKGDFRSALAYHERILRSTDSINSVSLKENTSKFNLMLDAERNREKITILLKDQQLRANIASKQRILFAALIGGVVMLIVLAIVIYSRYQLEQKANRQLGEQNAIITREKERSDKLLLNILPAEVAEELKAKGATTAKHYDDVTVLFTDFVNFTQAGENMNAQGLIDELHACFKTFDEITAKYNIEKIKTIGDAYLAVCGLPTADPKHAENVVRAAIEIKVFMQDRFSKLGRERTFKIRIGIHSGSVVAGIVGVKKFAYDIWGDTVNTAARMEQHGAAGRINISEATYDLVKDKFNCEYRGEVEAKGKGVMKMYFVS